MSRLRRTLLLLLLLASPPASPARAACQLAADGDGLVLTVAVRATPGQQLVVDWGDGARSSTSRRTAVGRGRAFLRHTYAAPGTYPVRATVQGGADGGCELALDVQVPYDNADDEAAAILPPRGAPDSSDALADAELGEALPAPPRADAPASPIPTGTSERPADESPVLGPLRRLIDWLRGR